MKLQHMHAGATSSNVAQDASDLAQTAFHIPAGNNNNNTIRNMEATQGQRDKFDETRDDLEFSNTFTNTTLSGSAYSQQVPQNRFASVQV